MDKHDIFSQKSCSSWVQTMNNNIATWQGDQNKKGRNSLLTPEAQNTVVNRALTNLG
jgi:mannosyltransferase OCH1-like enzyme